METGSRGVVSVASLVLFFVLPLQAQDTVGNIDFILTGPRSSAWCSFVLRHGSSIGLKAEITSRRAPQQSTHNASHRPDRDLSRLGGDPPADPCFLTAFQASRFSNGSHTIFLRVTNSDE